MSLSADRSPLYRRRSAFWVKMRVFAHGRLFRYPRLLAVARVISRMKRFMVKESKKGFAISLGTLRQGYRGLSEVDRAHTVDPRTIVYCSSREFPVADFKGAVIGGDWDLLEKKFEDLDIHAAFREVMTEGKPWSGTIFYQRIATLLDRGNILWGCKNTQELDQRCRKLESLFRSVQTEGFKSQNELHTLWLGKYNFWGDEEVGVSIGRHGDLLYCDGAHRLAIAKLLRLSGIPVEIAVRHPAWFRLRKDLIGYARRHQGVFDQPLPHPDLAHFPSRLDGEAIYSRIRTTLSARGGRLLEVGARFGYFCHKFEEDGFECLALEDSEEHVYFLERLRRAGNRRFRILRGGEEEEIIGRHFNVVLALHLDGDSIGPDGSRFRRVDFLKTLRTDELFVLHWPGQHSPAAPREGGLDPVRSLERSSYFKEVRCIGVLENGPVLYKFNTVQEGTRVPVKDPVLTRIGSRETYE